MQTPQPPRLAKSIFKWYCGNAQTEDLLGDLDEQFQLHVQNRSARYAYWKYWQHVFSLLFSYAIRKRKRDSQMSPFTSGFSLDMLRSYFKVAIRNVYQYKYISLLNAFGLAIGMSVSLLLISLVSYVRTYDDFHANKDRIYTITSTRYEGIDEIDYASSPIVLADELAVLPEIEEVVRIQSGFNEEIKMAQGAIPLRGYYVEPNFFKVFSYDLIKGDGEAALKKPNNIILTESAAIKLFNSSDVIGKTIESEQGGLLEIAAVMKDHPINSHLKFEALISYASLPSSSLSIQEKWTQYQNQYVYILLNKSANIQSVESHLQKIAKTTYATFPIKVQFQYQHLDDITMGPDFRNAIGPKWEASGMIVFAIIAALILLPACFNYTNISIARALKRSKEIGLRKTMGGAKRQIFFQFITETIVITFISFLGSLLLFFLIRTEFQQMLVASSALDLSLTVRTLFFFILFALLTGFFAGIFPALFFSGLNPIQALKSKVIGNGSSSMRVRKVLTVFQFALSFCFILSLVVFSRQYRYSINFDFGFTKENVVDVELQGVNPSLFKSEFESFSSVHAVSMSSDVLGLSYSTTWVKDNEKDSSEVAQLFVDPNYLNNFGLTLLAGKNFPNEVWKQEQYIIVNEEFLKTEKIPQPIDAIGRTYQVNDKELEIIGVVKNFHYGTLRLPIDKFFFRYDPAHFAYANLKVASTDAFALFTDFEKRWKNVSALPMKAHFFEDELNEGYSMYVVLLKIVGFLGLLAITISLLGMLGMVVYTSETKAKEVGIRKVMGASMANITYLLSKDYLKLMIWAIVLSAVPMVFLFDLFLTRIQYYSVQLNFWDVLISIVLLISLGLGTIASQTIKTASANPVDTLKVE